jgi:tRNA(adenine34) deaminase
MLSMKSRLESLKIRFDSHLNATSPSGLNSLAIGAVKEAFTAGRTGNYPVGALVANQRFQILSKGKNSVFHPRFDSKAHAEMTAISKMEAAQKSKRVPSGAILVCTLEPCLMCTARILLADIREVFYLWKDPTAGVSDRLNTLPPNYQELAKRVTFSEFKSDGELTAIAGELYLIGEELWNSKYNLSS